MLDFLKRHKIKDRKKLHAALTEYHAPSGIAPPAEDSENFDLSLPFLINDTMLSNEGFDSHFEPIASDPTPSFESGGGESGGGGASASWDSSPAEASSAMDSGSSTGGDF